MTDVSYWLGQVRGTSGIYYQVEAHSKAEAEINLVDRLPVLEKETIDWVGPMRMSSIGAFESDVVEVEKLPGGSLSYRAL